MSTLYPFPSQITRFAQSRFVAMRKSDDTAEYLRGLHICRSFSVEGILIPYASFVVLANQPGVVIEAVESDLGYLTRRYRIVPTAECPADVRAVLDLPVPVESADPLGEETAVETDVLAALGRISDQYPDTWASVFEVAAEMPANRGHLAGVLLPRLIRRDRVVVNFRGGEPTYRLMPGQQAVAS